MTSQFSASNYDPALEEVLKWADGADDATRATANGGGNSNESSESTWLDEFIARHGIPVLRREPWNGGLRLILRECVFNPQHKATSAALFSGSDGKPGYKCHHNECSGKRWKDVREKFEPRPRNDTTACGANSQASEGVRMFNVAELLALELPSPQLLIEDLLPKPGAVLNIGCSKSGKTVLAVQMAIAVASGHALFGKYRVLESGPVLFVEQDDLGAEASVKDYLLHSSVPVDGIPFTLATKIPFVFGDQLTDWLGDQISKRELRLVVLDSYTALRTSRRAGSDIVKLEQEDLAMLDELAKRTNCTILVLHHVSTSKVRMDWSEQGAGTFAMDMAVEGKIHVSRFKELDIDAPERLIRARARHTGGVQMLLRFRKEHLDYEQVLKGSGAALYPQILEIREHFGSRSFQAKDLAHATGVSYATAHRYLHQLCRSGCVTKDRFGVYELSI